MDKKEWIVLYRRGKKEFCSSGYKTETAAKKKAETLRCLDNTSDIRITSCVPYRSKALERALIDVFASISEVPS